MYRSFVSLAKRNALGRLSSHSSRPFGGPLITRRALTSDIGDGDTGHIEAKPNEGIIFFNNVFPLKLQWLLRFPFQGERYLERIENPRTAGLDPNEVLEKALPENKSMNVTGLIPRFKEGGAFVRFSHDELISNEEAEKKVRSYLVSTPLRPWWNPFVRIESHLVLGRPFVEDMLLRPPSARLKVEFVPMTAGETVDLSQERLYSLLRPFGRLREIESQPSDSKILPRYAYLDFAQVKRAIMAKNCLHGLEVPGEAAGAPVARLKISYEDKKRANPFTDWLSNHPRITLPILFALAAGFSVVVFDPMRELFIKWHVTRAFHIEDNKMYQWFVMQANDLISLRSHKKEEDAIWESRAENIEQLNKWLLETSDTFIVVQGPRGSGKRELVFDQALKGIPNQLVLDCKPIIDARGDSATIAAIADQVGYRPVFSWMNNISGLVDLAAQGATGMKTGFSETLDAQLAKILASTATALKDVALSGRTKDERKINPDSYLEAHPERLPVVVVDNFLSTKDHASVMVYDKIAEWAANLTLNNIAHVIFITNDVAYSKSLSKALPDRVFRQISLGDCAPDVAKRYVISHLDSDVAEPKRGEEKAPMPSETRTDLGELDESISFLGGRLTDLEFLARRIKAGEAPRQAVHEIIDQSTSEVLKMYLLPNTDGTKRAWTPEQAWILIRSLAKSDDLRYNEVLLDDAFKGANADATLQSLEQAELITIVSTHGRPHSIKPGKPVYLPAFRQLTSDKVLSSSLNLAILNEAIKNENASISKNEDELRLLGKLPKQPPELGGRIQWLLSRMQVSQAKIEKWEKEANDMKSILKTDY